ncbi:MAG: hypothetical protein A3E07_00455 [Candidatus Wildermuthbacteria bacterium RIFCSPHIGHO2_12_FULL_45_9]|nr:MAG: hypothetical protein A3E07_00455 [Candidatus Wildermuthbacteria bacterium RIFCSPHIGHO2_12_FULL_45_9]
MKKRMFVGSFLGIPILIASTYLFALPPRVVAVNISSQTQGEEVEVKITFDKPVRRQEIQAAITPFVHGEWKFEDPLFQNHLYRAVVFSPIVKLDPGIEYQVDLGHIKNRVGLTVSNDFSYVFEAHEISSEPRFSPLVAQESKVSATAVNEEKKTGDTRVDKPAVTLLDIPMDWQDSALSCEAASLKMALGEKGIIVSESDIMGRIGYDPTLREGVLWGDPFKRFVGDINGKMCTSGYGVFWEPVAGAAQHWRQAEAFSGWTLENLTRELQKGNPVMVWGALPKGELTDCSWYTAEGTYVKAFKETHVRLAVGFMGSADKPSHIILNDPLSGRLYWSSSEFLANWSVFGKSGVVIR